MLEELPGKTYLSNIVSFSILIFPPFSVKCTGDHEYLSCGPACDNVCCDLDTQSKDNCPIKNKKCVTMCYCEDGYARDYNGICVCIDDCPVVFKYKNDIYRKNNKTNICQNLIKTYETFEISKHHRFLIRTVFSILIQNLKDQQDVTFELANMIVGNIGFPFTEQFKRDTEYFNTDVENTDFSKNIEAAAFINAWGNWEHQFNKDNTKPRDFYLNDNKTVSVPTMFQQNTFKYGENPDIFAKSIESLIYQKVMFFMPRMDFSTNISNLKALLIQSNLTAPFEPNYDFRDIFANNMPLSITDAIQKSVLKVFSLERRLFSSHPLIYILLIGIVRVHSSCYMVELFYSVEFMQELSK
ncbi:Serpin-28, partial [Operophtera brumata]